MKPLQSDSVSELTGPIVVPVGASTAAPSAAICVHHGGRCFTITLEQATAFVRRVHRLMDTGGAELVPLLHDRGVDLLHISAQTPLQVHDIRDHSLDRHHS